MIEKEYFDYLKNKKEKVTENTIKKNLAEAKRLLDKAVKIGQIKQAEKLLFRIDSAAKELKLIKKGFNIYIEKDYIDEYIDEIAFNTVRAIELKRYEREIPDEIIEKIKDTEDIFDDYIILFTDYSGEETKKALEEREKEVDPIIFGIIKEKDDVIEKFYYIGDWEDEFCDLTLDKMIKQSSKKITKDINIDSITLECKKTRRIIEKINKKDRRKNTKKRNRKFFRK